MSKPTLLLQFRTDESLEHERKMIMRFGHFTLENMEAVNVLDPATKIPGPDDLDKYNGVITGASGQFNVTDWPDEIRTKVERVYPLLREIVRQDFPMLAICFGHQLLAELLGGRVETDKDQGEAGTLPVYVNDEGKKSKIFAGIASPFYVVLGHKDSVTKLPEGAVLLASSDKCKVQAYQIGKNIFCTQFHAELDLEGMIWRMTKYPEYLQGRSVEDLRTEYHDIPDAPKIIDNFHGLISKSKGC